MEYNSGSNRASNFKSAEREARGQFEITSTITPELYDTKSYYQLIVSITKCTKLFVVSVKTGRSLAVLVVLLVLLISVSVSFSIVFYSLKALEINSAEQVVKF